MVRVGLVLGAGGTVGQAYHAGVLAALEHDLGWDPRDADVVVGTSAGSVTASLLRLGVPAHDLAAWAVNAPLSVESGPLREYLRRRRPPFPPLRLEQWVRPWRLPRAALVARIATRPWALRPAVAAMTLMPTGTVDLLEHTSALSEAADEAWPGGMWICAARRDDGGRVVFGQPGSPPATITEAVAASCAIPGYFAPVDIGGVEYFDGGVHSPSNADVLRPLDLDVVVAVSPMSAARGRSRTADAPLRWSVHRRLERELGRLARRGTAVVRIEPGRRVLHAMGVNMMAPDRADAVVQAAFVDTGRYTARPEIAERLADLTVRRRRLQVLGRA